METEDIIAIVSLGITVISLVWVYVTNRKLEKYKGLIALEQSHMESKLQQELRYIQELVGVLREGRLLIEKRVVRKRKVKKAQLQEVLVRLEDSYSQSLLFLEKTQARIDNSSMAIFTHEHKNKLRSMLEELASSDTEKQKGKMGQGLETLKDQEKKLIEKLGQINDSLFDLYKKEMKK
ncbi:hypothetical protein [Spongiimicrobium sp. 2-473A-2-J]|uniref:hypothetical protein n=1 Tax=Eudoraea algarum TaxID=3417568 RepID=UPI003D35FA8C